MENIIKNQNNSVKYFEYKKERQSNIEILRIFAMFTIVLGHFLGQSQYISISSGFEKYIFIILGSGLRIAVGVFIMIGCWFMVNEKFKALRVINLHLQQLFYTLSILFYLKIAHINVSLWHTLRSIFPLSLFGVWFVSAYIVLILLSPFLNKILEWERKTLKHLLILAFFIVPLLSMVFIKMDTKLCVFLAFIYYYLNIGYFRKYLYNCFNINKYFLLLIGGGIYLVLASIKYYCLTNNISGILYKVVNSYLMDYHNLLNIICAFSIFYYFIKTNMGVHKIINYISSVTLTVYIIHQAPGFINYLWFNIYRCEQWLTSKYVLLYVLFIPVSLYVVSIVLELFRKNFIMPFITKCRMYKFVENKINEFYNL